ncbi:PepSY-associated TM helix domain-containing protein [Sphingobacterium sp. LRF_L2]|uniref:PepSY-associated TM helix domain-containing protein n=1 Tax=Sphingobacterium sp. LRF_L2 TaxID=3369421 RepID=UPI003F61D5BB
MPFKKIALFLHRWLGLLSGLVVFVVSTTGAIFVFEEELFSVFHPELCQVDVPKNGTYRPLSALLQQAQNAVDSGKQITLVRTPATTERNKPFVFEAVKRRAKTDVQGFFINEEIYYWDRVFVDPYNGKVLGKIDVEMNFFWIVRQVHQFLYLRRDVGSTIVGSSTIIFVFILISGLWLWWPKNQKVAIKRMKIDFTAKWKRINYDLHQVLGFYVFCIAIVIACTGLVWSFKWWENSIYLLLDGKRPNLQVAPPTASLDTILKITHDTRPIDLIWKDIQTKHVVHEGIYMNILSEVQQLNGIVYYDDRSWWSASDLYAYDLRNGKAYNSRLQHEKTMGMKWRNSNYDIHVGKIAGIPGMIVAFLGSIICASLPITGFYVWYGRKFKKSKAKKVKIPVS